MQVQTNRWMESRTGTRYVGCVGYDDPVYEDYTYTENCSEDVIVFDSVEERRQFHSRVVTIKLLITPILKKRELDIKAKYESQYLAEMEKYDADCLAYEKRQAARSILRRMFNLDSPPGYWMKPQWPEYDDKIKRELSHDSELADMRRVYAFPDKHELFIQKVLLQDYEAVVKMEERFKNNAHTKY